MSKPIVNGLKYLLFLGMGLLLLWWAYKDTDLDEILHSLSKSHWGWILVALVLNYTATALRGIRWNILLEPLGHRADTWTSIHSVAFGYLMNDLVPRSGEVARCTLLNRAEKIPLNGLIGTVLLERIVDVLMLGLILVLSLWLHGNEMAHLFSQVDAGKGTLLLKLALAALAGLMFLLFVLRTLKHIPIVARINSFFSGVGRGLRSIITLRRKGLFFLYTIGIWGTWLIMTQCMMFALDETKMMRPDDSLFLMAAASLAMLIPTQGGLGAYHFVTKLAFVALGLGETVGLTFAAISWTGKTILEIAAGVTGFIAVTSFKMKKP